MSRPKRDQQIPQLAEAIKSMAWQHIAMYGAPALSLRAIARDLNITAPAIYNYFPRRDDLVTALVIDAFSSFGNSQLAAHNAIPTTQANERLHAIGMAYREWAITHPQHYQLIFGTPIPCYIAPYDLIAPVAERSMSALVQVVEDFRVAGRLETRDLPMLKADHMDSDLMVSKTVATLIWSRVHGLVSLELTGNQPLLTSNAVTLYEYELQSIVRQFIKS